jgi:hypothetical protein
LPLSTTIGLPFFSTARPAGCGSSPSPLPVLPPLPQEFAAAVEHGDLVRPVVRDVDMVVVVDRHPERPGAGFIARAVFAKVGEPLLLARRTIFLICSRLMLFTKMFSQEPQM